MVHQTNKNNSARKKYLDFDFPLQEEEQKVIDQDLNSLEFTDFKNNSKEKVFLPDRYSSQSTFEKIEKRISGMRIGKWKQQRYYWSIAASVAALLVVCFLFTRQFWDDQPKIILVSTGYGERLEVVLPDSSVIVLNAMSSLSYPKEFAENERKITLEGEGYFHVTKDQSKPFIVHSGDIKVQVLGTIFNMKAYENENRIETALLEGSISLSTNNGKPAILLPGEIAFYDKTYKSLEVEKVTPAGISSWKENQLVFENCPLQEICKILERQKDISIIIEDESLRNFRITAKFIHGEKPDEILQVLGNSGNFKSLRKGKSYYINSH